MPESKHDQYMRLYRKHKGDSAAAQEALEREEEEEREMDPKTARVGEKIKKAVRDLGKQGEAKKLVKGTPIVKGNKIVGKKGGVQNPNIEVQTDSYDPTLDFAERVMSEAFDRMKAGELKDYDSKSLKPGSQPGHRRSATPEERKRYAKVFQQSRGGASTKVKRKRDLQQP